MMSENSKRMDEKEDNLIESPKDDSLVASEVSEYSSVHYSSGSDILLTEESVYNDIEVHEFSVNKTQSILTGERKEVIFGNLKEKIIPDELNNLQEGSLKSQKESQKDDSDSSMSDEKEMVQEIEGKYIPDFHKKKLKKDSMMENTRVFSLLNVYARELVEFERNYDNFESKIKRKLYEIEENHEKNNNRTNESDSRKTFDEPNIGKYSECVNETCAILVNVSA